MPGATTPCRGQLVGGLPALAFRPLARADFPLVSRWLAEPLVARWWHQDASPEGVEAEFGPCLDGREPTRVFLMRAGGRAVGLIQRYPVAAYREYLDELAAVWPVPPGALSIDYLLGEPDARGRGLGGALIGAFAARSWVEHPEAQDIVVPVSAANRASWRSLERAGFVRVAEGELEPDNPRDSRDHVIYRLRRPAHPGR